MTATIYSFREFANDHIPPKPLNEIYAPLDHYVGQFNLAVSGMVGDLKTGSTLEPRWVAKASKALYAVNSEASKLADNQSASKRLSYFLQTPEQIGLVEAEAERGNPFARSGTGVLVPDTETTSRLSST